MVKFVQVELNITPPAITDPIALVSLPALTEPLLLIVRSPIVAGKALGGQNESDLINEYHRSRPGLRHRALHTSNIPMT